MAEAEVSLLESFPSPPTHIPNPPPSAPPALPLPPVPGPSPISDNFLRRSIASYRDSIADDRVPAAPLSDIDDDDDPDPPRKSHRYNESISDIQLPLSDQDDEDDSVHTAIFIPDLIDPVALHLQIRASRSRSESHKQYLRARSVSPSRSPVPPKRSPPPVPPSIPAQNPRPASPDIPALLSNTPRPRRHRSFLYSDTTEPVSGSQPLPRRVSDGDIAIERARRKHRKRPFNMDHAVAFPSQHANGAEIENKLERQLDGDGDSDSSLDIHTPLPYVFRIVPNYSLTHSCAVASWSATVCFRRTRSFYQTWNAHSPPISGAASIVLLRVRSPYNQLLCNYSPFD
jgi:hypothetical protein